MRQNYKVHWVVDIISTNQRKSDSNDNEALPSTGDKTDEDPVAMNASEAAQVDRQQNPPRLFWTYY